MPKLNGRGDVIMGVAGIQGSLNGTPYPFGAYGRGCWLDDDTILVALATPPPGSGAAAGAVFAWRPFDDPHGQALELKDPRPFNFIAGGGGRWIALMVPGGEQAPIQFGSLGDHPWAGAGDVALDGTAIYKTAYYGSWGLTIVRPDGSIVNRVDGYPLDYVAVGAGAAIWFGGAEGRPLVRPYFADARYVKIVRHEGEDWLLYWSNDNGLILQPDGGVEGFVFLTQTAFDFDAIALDGAILIASSTTQGEGPSDRTIVRVTRAGVEYLVGSGPRPVFGPLERVAAPPPPPPPPQPPPQPPPPPKPPPPPPPPPPPFRSHVKGSAMDIDGKIVRLRGAGGLSIAPDAPNTGTWGGLNQGWRGVRYVGESDPAARLRARKLPNGRYTFTSETTNGLAGADATSYSAAIDKQGYFKPDGNTDAGDYEQWRVYDGNENGAIEAQIEHVTDGHHADGAGRKFFAFPLAVELVS